MGCSQAVRPCVTATDDDHMFARRHDARSLCNALPFATAVLLLQEFHGKVNSSQLASRNCEIAWLLCSSRQQQHVEIAPQVLNRNVLSDMGIDHELHAFS